SLTIRGPGPHGIISGNNSSRVFHITPGTIVTLDSLTITNGMASTDINNFPANAGGGIYSDHAKLTVTNCALSNNLANLGGGISNDGFDGTAMLAMSNSTVSGNSVGDNFNSFASGGGIYNNGTFKNILGPIIFGPVTGDSTGGSAVDYQVNFTAGQEYVIT